MNDAVLRSPGVQRLHIRGHAVRPGYDGSGHDRVTVVQALAEPVALLTPATSG